VNPRENRNIIITIILYNRVLQKTITSKLQPKNLQLCLFGLYCSRRVYSREPKLLHTRHA